MGIIKNIAKVLFYKDAYGIAFKKNIEDSFDVVYPPNRFSYADPFVFEHKGKTAVFVELMDKKYGWGTIGVFEIIDGNIQPFKEIIREKNHMSFPNVFIHNGVVYMIPETYGANDVHMYRCVDFPYSWEKTDPLIEDVKLVDHSLIDLNKETYIVSYDLDVNSSRCFILNWTSMKLKEIYPAGDFCKERPGGTFFYENGNLKRVIQDCRNTYGDYLKIYSVNKLDKEAFEEKLEKEIRIEDIKFKVSDKFDHIHQYSKSDGYDVIDVRYEKFYFNKLLWFLYRVIFRNKRDFK
jgi:hypothetical protein